MKGMQILGRWGLSKTLDLTNTEVTVFCLVMCDSWLQWHEPLSRRGRVVTTQQSTASRRAGAQQPRAAREHCVSGKAKQEALSQSRFSSLSVWVWENESVGRMSVRKVLENAREEEAKTRRAEEGLELALNRIMKGERGSEDGE